MDTRVSLDEDLVRDAMEVSGEKDLDQLLTKCLKAYLLLRLRKQRVIKKFKGAFNRESGDNGDSHEPMRAVS